jgi:hypothetical protein
LLDRALRIFENQLGRDNANVGPVADNLGVLYSAQGDFVRAEAYLRRGLTILQATLPPDHPRIARALENYAGLMEKTNRSAQARSLRRQVKDLRKRNLRDNLGGLTVDVQILKR